MVSSCILCKTNSLNTDVSTHSFPTDPERRLLWLKAINRTTVCKNARLCSKHFEPKFHRYSVIEQRRFLLPTAVPTLYLCTGNENDINDINLPQTNLLCLLNQTILNQPVTSGWLFFKGFLN